jgi:hypothetical protein
MVIGCLDLKGRACPLGLRMPSTCAWHPSTMQPRPCRAPGSPACFCRSFYPQIDTERPPSAIGAMGLAAGCLQGGGSVLKVQTVSSPDRGGGHLLFQDIDPLYTGWVVRSLTLRRDNKHSELGTCGLFAGLLWRDISSYGAKEGSYMDYDCFQRGSRSQIHVIRPTDSFFAIVRLHTELEESPWGCCPIYG